MTKFLAIFIIVFTLLVGGYFAVQKTLIQKQTSQSIEKITIAQANQPSFALLYIADAKGFFKEEGLEVTYNKFAFGRDALLDTIAQKSDVATVFESPFVRNVLEGQKISILSSLHNSNKNTAVVGRVDRGIKTVEDLKNKKIGVGKGTADEFFLYSLLTSSGIQISQVTIIDTKADELLPSIQTGKVDGVALGNARLYDAQKLLGDNGVTLFNNGYTEYSVLVTRTELLETKKEAFIRLLKALVKAEKYYRKNKEESDETIANALPEVSKESIENVLNNINLSLNLNNVLLTLLNREGQWFKDNGIYKTEVPDFRKAIFTDYLKSVKPEAVTLY